MVSHNNPNVLDNKLDQVPKTGKFYKEFLDSRPFQEEILNFFKFSDLYDIPKEYADWFAENVDFLDIAKIRSYVENNPGEIGIEIDRSDAGKPKDFTPRIGPLKSIEGMCTKYFLLQDSDNKNIIQPGDILTLLLFSSSDESLRQKMKIRVIQIQKAGNFTPDSLWFTKENEITLPPLTSFIKFSPQASI